MLLPALRRILVRARVETALISMLVDSEIDNISMRGEVRVDIPIGSAYKERIAQARAVMLDAVRSAPCIEAERSEVVATALGSSSVDLELRVWIRNAEGESRAHVECLEAAKVALDKADIQIPFPHMQLFVDTIEGRAVESLERAIAG